MTKTQQTYSDLIHHLQETATLSSCASLLGWDERTYLPQKGSAFRGNQMGLLARLTHERMTSPKIGEALSALEGTEVTKDSTSPEAANLREIRRNYDRAVKLPPKLVEELAKVTIQAQGVWQQARQNNDFASFQPWLEKIVTLKKQEADAVGYQEHPYNALLDEYEPGATAKEISLVFADLAKELVPIIQSVTNSKNKPNKEILEREYPVETQKAFANTVAGAIGFDFQAGRLDVTTHPFCSGIAPGDCRITTRYNPRFFNEAFFGTLHEAGHGLYEQGLPEEHFGTPLGTAASLGIHESQSRLWENQVGRGRPFWDYFFPKTQELFPTSLRDVSVDEWLLAINEVKPSFIRVEADEATYNLHIILRFELEQSLLTGNLKPQDVPGAWNEKFQKLFGITPPDNKMGCLQDIHWSMGGIGYFPTYTLGNLYSAQLMAQAKKDLPGLEEDFRRGEFARLKAWLNEKIHCHGQRYRAKDLCQRITGESLRPAALVDYLKAKYSELYAL